MHTITKRKFIKKKKKVSSAILITERQILKQKAIFEIKKNIFYNKGRKGLKNQEHIKSLQPYEPKTQLQNMSTKN